MAKNRFTYLCALVGSIIFYIAYREWLSWLLLMGLLGLPWLSLLLSLGPILTTRIRVSAPAFAPLGGEGRVNLRGTGKLAVPRFGGRIRLTRLTTGEQWRLKEGGALPTGHCGGLRAEPEKVWICDLLGLFRFRVKNPRSCTVLVRPAEVPMGALPDLSRYLARAWRPKPGGGYAENHEMRLYRPGDNLNQVHWKLTAKTGKLTIREPMEPDRGLVLLTLDIRGTADELDRVFGRLLWLGRQLCGMSIVFEIRALAREGILCFPVKTAEELDSALDRLLCARSAAEGSILNRVQAASWHRHIGGEPDET